MAYRTLTDAAKHTQNDFLPAIVETIIKSDQTMAFMDTFITDRPAIQFAREASVPSASYVTCASTMTSEALSADSVTFSMKTIALPFEVCDRVQGLASTFTDQIMAELRAAAKGMSQKLADGIVNGNGTTEIYGWDTLFDGSAIDAGSSLTLDHLEQAMDNVETNGSKKAFVGGKAAIRAVRRELRENAGGLAYVDLAGGAMKVPSYLDVVALINENVDDNVLFCVDFDLESNGVGLAVSQKDANNIDGLFDLVSGGRIYQTIRDYWQLVGDFAQIVKNPSAIAKITAVA